MPASPARGGTFPHRGRRRVKETFIYVYDAWNRLVAVKSAADGGAVTIQTAEFDALGRRIKKVVTNAGVLDRAGRATARRVATRRPGDRRIGPVKDDRTEVYYYDGQRIIETRGIRGQHTHFMRIGRSLGRGRT